MSKKVFVALSGGVDSSVAAYLLKKEGYSVHCVYMKNWEECDWHEERRSAETVAAKLELPFEVWDFTKEYKQYILENFFLEYEKGATPNPDILCNSIIKFGYFLKKAKKSGGAFIATGHHVRKTQDNLIKKGLDSQKDQSYFLWQLTHDQCRSALFPVGEYKKENVRAIAKRAGLHTHDRKDSQGLCFVGTVHIREFLEKNIKTFKGDIVNEKSERLGTHTGLAFYTEGQREGVGVGGQKEALYIAYRDTLSGAMIVAPKSSELLLSSSVLLRDTVFSRDVLKEKILHAKIRYRQEDQEVMLVKEGNRYRLLFKKAQRAVSEGQSAVLYDEDVLIGGGIIDKVERPFKKIEKILTRHGNQ